MRKMVDVHGSSTADVNAVDARDLLPHQRPQADIDKLYPRMMAPDEYGDCDFEAVSQAELWVVCE